ncbi:hypothetical protein LDENG_00127600 [Lucifuga dentata]|nr:hypothetical protein LDENG_00127600 [Lucifuga dentata]
MDGGDGQRSPVGPQLDDHLSSTRTSAPELVAPPLLRTASHHLPPGSGPKGRRAHTLGYVDHPRCLLSVPPWSGT